MKIKTIVAAGMIAYLFVFINFLLFGLVPFQLFVISYSLFLVVALLLALLLSKTLRDHLIMVLFLGILLVGSLVQFSAALRENYDISVKVKEETVKLGNDIGDLGAQISYMQKIIANQKITAESYLNISKEIVRKIETEKNQISVLEFASPTDDEVKEELPTSPIYYEEYQGEYEEDEYDD
ncbi:MAG: hypothetical protein ABIJ34_02145 [archaeon]